MLPLVVQLLLLQLLLLLLVLQQLLLLLSGHCQLLLLPAVLVSCSCQLVLLLLVLQLLSLLQLSGHCSCSCLATAAAHSLLLVLQLFLPAAAAADGVAAAPAAVWPLPAAADWPYSIAKLEETPLIDQVNDLDHRSEQSTRVCLRRKIILGLGYIDVTVPLRNLSVLAGCILVQPQLVLLCLLL